MEGFWIDGKKKFGFYLKKGKKLGKIFLGRGLGWMILGLGFVGRDACWMRLGLKAWRGWVFWIVEI